MALLYLGGLDLLLFGVISKSCDVLFTPLLCWMMLGELPEPSASEIMIHRVSLCFEGSY